MHYLKNVFSWMTYSNLFFYIGEFYPIWLHYDQICFVCIFKCATSSCLQRQEENDFAVEMFRASLQSRGPFQCYVSAEHDDEALMYKVYKLSTIFNALFWPLGAFIFSVLIISLLYVVDQCKVWNTDSILIA